MKSTFDFQEEEKRRQESVRQSKPDVINALHASSDDVSDESGFFAQVSPQRHSDTATHRDALTSFSREKFPVSSWPAQRLAASSSEDSSEKRSAESHLAPSSSPVASSDTALDDQGYASQLNSPSKQADAEKCAKAEVDTSQEVRVCNEEEVNEAPIQESVATRKHAPVAPPNTHLLSEKTSSKKRSRSRCADVTSGSFPLRKSASLVLSRPNDVTTKFARKAGALQRTRTVRERADDLVRMYKTRKTRAESELVAHESTNVGNSSAVRTTYITTLERWIDPSRSHTHAVRMQVEGGQACHQLTGASDSADINVSTVELGKPVSIVLEGKSHCDALQPDDATQHESQQREKLPQECVANLHPPTDLVSASHETNTGNRQTKADASYKSGFNLHENHATTSLDDVINNKDGLPQEQDACYTADKSRDQVPVTNIDDFEVYEHDNDSLNAHFVETTCDEITANPRNELLTCNLKSPISPRSSIKASDDEDLKQTNFSSQETQQENMKTATDPFNANVRSESEDDVSETRSDVTDADDIVVNGLNTQEFEDLINLCETPAREDTRDVTDGGEAGEMSMRTAENSTNVLGGAQHFNAEVRETT